MNSVEILVSVIFMFITLDLIYGGVYDDYHFINFYEITHILF